MARKQSPPETASLGWDPVDPVDPAGGSYMPLSDAAYWIATDGHSKSVDVTLPEIWERALQQLSDRISADEVKVIGRRGGVGTAIQIEGHRFAGVGVVLPAFVGTDDDPPPEITTNDPTLLCDFTIGNNWHNQFNDKLYADLVLQFSHLMVKKTDIARLWPSRLTVGTRTTGARKSRPGRKPGTTDYDWDEGKLFAFKKFNENGDFADPTNRVDGWKTQADLERAVIEHMARVTDKQPAGSTTREKVALWLAEWRSQQMSEN
jgi:hypothetical protein